MMSMADSENQDPSRVDWRLFFAIFGAGMLGIVGLVPYLSLLLAPAAAKSGVALSNLVVMSSFQSGIFLFLATLLGMRMAKRVGYQMPFFSALAAGKNWQAALLGAARLSIPLGLLTGALIVAADQGFRWQGIIVELEPAKRPGPLEGLSAALYGGLTEEILARLFLVSVFSWVVLWISRQAGKPLSASNGVAAPAAWSGIVVAAVLFGVMHLPATAEIVALSAPVVLRALVLNGIGALVFGVLFWKRGLAASMLAHLSADLVLHVFWPLISR